MKSYKELLTYMSNYDPYSPFNKDNLPNDSNRDRGRDDDSGNSIGEQYSFDQTQYQPQPDNQSWPTPTQPAPNNFYHQTPGVPETTPTNYPTSGQPMSGQPMSGQPVPPPQYGYPQNPRPFAPPPTSGTTSFMSTGRVWMTVGIAVGAIFLLILLCVFMGFLGASQSYRY